MYSASEPFGSQTAPANSTLRVLVASLIGTTVEFYDFYVYATAAVLVFPHLFFPSGDPTTALLASFAVFGAAMIARPLGAIYFGHLGDKKGRKFTLVGALLTMGVATFLIGLLPTYAMVGWLAPLLLVVMRLAQGFALGGEWSGAALVATENAPAGKRAVFGTFPQLGAPLGFIIANSLFLLIAAWLPSDNPGRPSEEFLTWGWRIPFIFSAVMVIIGLWVRLNLVESRAFNNVINQKKVVRLPLGNVIKQYGWELVLGTFYMLATYVLFYLITAFSLSYGTAPTTAAVPGLGYDYTTFVWMMVFGAVFFGIFTLFSGPWADRWGRRRFLDPHHGADLRLRPHLGSAPVARRARRHRVAGDRLRPHGRHLRADGGAAARAVPGERSLHGLRHLLQRVVNHRRCRGSVHRRGPLALRRRRPLLGRRLPCHFGRADADSAVAGP